jgi:putative transposase
VGLRLRYLIFVRLRLAGPAQPVIGLQDAGLLVPRHEVAVLRRANPRPRLDWAAARSSPRSPGLCRQGCGGTG